VAQTSGQHDGVRLAEHSGRPDPRRQRSYDWQDPAVSAAAAPTMAGIDFFRALLDGKLPVPPIAATLDFTLVAADPGRVVFEFTPAEFHYNPIGSVHGGVYAVMCDSACGCAVHSMLPKGAYYTSQDLSVKFLRAITERPGRCGARARSSTSAPGPRWRRPGSPMSRGSCTRTRRAAA
jgi:uncharacterized protein (TIGR00369 family)